MFSRFTIQVLVLTGVLILLVPAAAAQSAGGVAGTIEVIVRGCSNDDGHVRIGLHAAHQGFDADAFRSAAASIQAGTATHVFENIPYGTYAIRLFHDANDNDKLDTHFMGTPKEAYGFSNNARGRFGPPSFDEAAFVLDADSLMINITVR